MSNQQCASLWSLSPSLQLTDWLRDNVLPDAKCVVKFWTRHHYHAGDQRMFYSQRLDAMTKLFSRLQRKQVYDPDCVCICVRVVDNLWHSRIPQIEISRTRYVVTLTVYSTLVFHGWHSRAYSQWEIALIDGCRSGRYSIFCNNITRPGYGRRSQHRHISKTMLLQAGVLLPCLHGVGDSNPGQFAWDICNLGNYLVAKIPNQDAKDLVNAKHGIQQRHCVPLSVLASFWCIYPYQVWNQILSNLQCRWAYSW